MKRTGWPVSIVVPVAVLATVSGCTHAGNTAAGGASTTRSASEATRTDAPVDVDSDLVDENGTVLGTAALVTGTPGEGVGAHVQVRVHGLDPGLHAMALHAVGRCAPGSGEPFGSAGGRLTDGVGGSEPPGALPSLLVTQDAFGSIDTTVGTVDISTLVDGDGAALLVYAEPGPDPTAAGAPVACAAFPG